METDCFQLVFFITVLHHNTGLLFQHVILVNFLLVSMVFVFVEIVCTPTRAAIYTLFLIFPFVFFNSLSAHHKVCTGEGTNKVVMHMKRLVRGFLTEDLFLVELLDIFTAILFFSLVNTRSISID